MKVTSLKQQIKNPERVSVFVDAKYSFSLTLSQVVSEKLKVGLELDQSTLLSLREKSTNEKLRMKALNWVMLRPHSVRELQEYLRRAAHRDSSKLKKNSEPSDLRSIKTSHEFIIDDFIKRGWVDDQTFARWWVERSSRASRSRSFLRSELMSKGVSREIIEDALSDKDEDTILTELITKCRTKSKYQDEQKLFRYLMSKGFSYSSVADALKLGADDRPD